MTTLPLFKYDIISDFHCVAKAINVGNRNFIVIPFLLYELISNMANEFKITSLFIFVAQKNY